MRPINVVLIAAAVMLIQGCYPDPVANFDFSYTDNTAPATISFSNYSTDAEEYLWNFGDGNTSTSHSPTHTYTEGGTYTISLTATGRGGENTMSKSINIIQPTTYVVRNYTSYTLYAVQTFYWDGDNILELVDHGDMASGTESTEWISEYDEITVAFELIDGTLALVWDPYPLVSNMRNYLDIFDNTDIYTSTSTSMDMLSEKTIRSIREKGKALQLRELMGQ